MKIRKLHRCPSAKYSFAIDIEASDLFETMDELKLMLGDKQHPRDAKYDENNPRPWYFIFVRDSTNGAWRDSDGSVEMRLYINCEEIAIQFKLMCETK